MTMLMFYMNILSIVLSLASLCYINKYTSKIGPIKTLNLIFISFALIGLTHLTDLREVLHDYHTMILPFLQFIILITYIIEIRVIKYKGNWLPSDILNNLPDLLWVKDVDGKFLYANDAMCKKILLTSTANVIGKTCLDIAIENTNKNIEYDFGEMCYDSDELVIANRKPGRFLEIGRVANDFIAIQVIKAPIYDKKGNICGTVGCGRDLTYDLKDHVKLQKLYENKNYEDFEKLFEEHKYRHLMVDRKKCPNYINFENGVDI